MWFNDEFSFSPISFYVSGSLRHIFYNRMFYLLTRVHQFYIYSYLQYQSPGKSNHNLRFLLLCELHPYNVSLWLLSLNSNHIPKWNSLQLTTNTYLPYRNYNSKYLTENWIFRGMKRDLWAASAHRLLLTGP